MKSTHVKWGEDHVKLTWIPSNHLPQNDLITSVHGFCFYQDKMLLVRLTHRGWDFPGGHIEINETPEECIKREIMEEGYVDGVSSLLGYIIVDHSENPNWNENSKYPKNAYQVFYRIDVDQLHEFQGKYEADKRIFVNPDEIPEYYKDWHILYQEILDYAIS